MGTSEDDPMVRHSQPMSEFLSLGEQRVHETSFWSERSGLNAVIT